MRQFEASRHEPPDVPPMRRPAEWGVGVLAKAPSGKRDQAMQEAFNRWEEQSGLDLTSISRTLALSVDSPPNAAGRQ